MSPPHSMYFLNYYYDPSRLNAKIFTINHKSIQTCTIKMKMIYKWYKNDIIFTGRSASVYGTYLITISHNIQSAIRFVFSYSTNQPFSNNHSSAHNLTVFCFVVALTICALKEAAPLCHAHKNTLMSVIQYGVHMKLLIN